MKTLKRRKEVGVEGGGAKPRPLFPVPIELGELILL